MLKSGGGSAPDDLHTQDERTPQKSGSTAAQRASAGKGIPLAPEWTFLPAIGASKAAVAGARTTVTSLPRLVGCGVAVARVVTPPIAHNLSVCTQTKLADILLAAGGNRTAEGQCVAEVMLQLMNFLNLV